MIIRKLVTRRGPDLIYEDPDPDLNSFLSTPIILKSGQNTPRLTDHGNDSDLSYTEEHVRPKTSHSRTVPMPRSRKSVPDLPAQARKAFEAATVHHIEERRRKHEIVNRYQNRMTKFEVEVFRRRYSGQRRIELKSKTKCNRVLESSLMWLR